MPINIILPPSDKGRNLALYPSLPCVRGDSPQCGEMSRSDRGDRRRQRVDFCVAKRRRGCKLCGSQFSTPIKLYIVFTLSLMPRRARPFLCRRKERAERFAFKGGISIPPFELSELKSLLKVFQAWLRQLKDRF